MDSLSQIVLGAAVGEAVLGRRIGNRAMIWGAVAGTIPDMDVLGKYFLSELDNLAFHRGISHSLSFLRVGCVGRLGG
jgi:inner membrane protein